MAVSEQELEFYRKNYPPSEKVKKLWAKGLHDEANQHYMIQVGAGLLGISEHQYRDTYADYIELERRKVGTQLVYFVAHSENPADGDPVKIGVAADVDERLRGMQTSSPTPLYLLGTAEGGRELEASLHEQFKAQHIRLEWFSMCPELRRLIRKSRRQLRLGDEE